MTNIAINTTQNVNIQFTAASIGERILAFVLDYVVKISYVIVVFYLFSPLLNRVDYWGAAGLVSIILLPVMFYTLLSETFMNGQTLGKKVMNIKVVKLEGFEANFTDYVSRWLFNLIDILISSGAVATISIIISNNNQRLGDMVAGTTVISLKKRIGINQTILQEVQVDYIPIFPAAQFLSDKDASIIKNNFDTALQNGNYELLTKLREKLEEVLKTEKGNRGDIEFIETVLKDFNYYTGK